MIQIIINDIGNKVRATLLTGLSLVNSEIAATDTVLQAFGKLQAQISNRIVKNATITGATKTKITYDANGLVTAGADATATDVDALKRDGSNANSDIDIGNFKLNAQSFHVKGTGGNGHIGLKHQSSNITASGSESSLGANNSGNPVWKNDGNAIQDIMLRNADIVAATKTKITYDAKGLVTSGTDATTADINDSSNRRYVTDAQQTVIGNTSGTNTGDNATNTQYSGLAALIATKAGTTAYMTAGDVTTTSNVASNITGLVGAVAANTRYRIFGVIRIGCNNTGGVSFTATAPASATLDISLFGFTTTTQLFRYNRISVAGTLYGTFCNVNSTVGFIYVMGEIETAGTAGNVQFQFASGTNLQTSTVFETGTWLNLTEL